MEEGRRTIVVQHRGRPGILAGLLGCVFGVLGILTLGSVFVPLAALCSVIGLLRGLTGLSVSGIAVSLLGGVLTIIGFVVSPSLWLILSGLLVASQVHGPATPAANIPAMTDNLKPTASADGKSRAAPLDSQTDAPQPRADLAPTQRVPAPSVVISNPFGPDNPKLSVEQISTQCIFIYRVPETLSKLPCKVEHIEMTEFKIFDGPDMQIAMQIQLWDEPTIHQRQFVLFASKAGIKDFQIIPAEYQNISDDYTLIGVQSGMLGRFLVIEGISGASGHSINYYVYRQEPQLWALLEADNWHQQRVDDFLPKGFYAAAPDVVDFGVGLAVHHVYRPNDPLCCPTGGEILVQIALRGNKFVVSKVRYLRDLN